jgi:hypothetical protein
LNDGVKVGDIVAIRSDSYGKPKPYKGRLAPTGIAHIDQVTDGIRLNQGGVYAIQGIEGSRKTSILLNIVINQCLSGALPDKDYMIEWDSLESGMPVERIADMMVSMLANRFISYWHVTGTKEYDYFTLAKSVNPEISPVNLITGPVVNTLRENVINPEYLDKSADSWTTNQRDAIEIAKQYVYSFPVIICGISADEDKELRKAKTTITWDLETSKKRWERNARDYGVRQIVIDHITKYVIKGRLDALQAMEQGIPAMQEWQARWEGGLHWVVAQISAGQRLAYRGSEDNATAYGGPLLAMESTAIWEVTYKPKKTPYYATMEVLKSRIGWHKPIAIPIEPQSGAIIGQSRYLSAVGELQ